MKSCMNVFEVKLLLWGSAGVRQIDSDHTIRSNIKLPREMEKFPHHREGAEMRTQHKRRLFLDDLGVLLLQQLGMMASKSETAFTHL